MRIVKWVDDAGYNHLSLVRDSDPDNEAQWGVTQDPPDLRSLDWDAIVQEMHNLLVDRGLITWQDVQMSGNGVSAVVQTVLKRKIISLYREAEK